MSNKNLIGILIIFVAFLAITPTGLALSEDFSITTQKDVVDACSCGFTATTYTIRNTGSVTSTYEILKTGNAAQYSTLSENFFVLEPNEAKDITNYLNMPCNAEGIFNEYLNV